MVQTLDMVAANTSLIVHNWNFSPRQLSLNDLQTKKLHALKRSRNQIGKTDQVRYRHFKIDRIWLNEEFKKKKPTEKWLWTF